MTAASLLTLAVSCGGHDPDVRTAQYAVVGDNDPLPIPPDTVGPTDATNGVAVGAIPGSADVGADGQAHYHIPIWVAPGRAGMQPQLSLDYDSRGGNGLVGVGWTLSGLSQINRCPHRIASDGQARPVVFDSRDVFCLDGEPLKPFGSGFYQTEHNTFALVSRDKDQYGLDAGFTVREKSGRILHYANQVGDAGRAPSYLLTKTEDRYGNTITYQYQTTHATTVSGADVWVSLPLEIDYTGSNTDTKLVANRSVTFTYEDRDDKEFWFNVGNVRLAQRLKTIVVSGPDATGKKTALRQYTLTYATPAQLSITKRSLLKSVSVSARGVSLGTTDFDWELGAAGVTRIPTSVGDYDSGDDHRGYVLADFNGDGFEDLFYLTKDPQGNAAYAVRLWDSGHADFGAANLLQDGVGGYLRPTAAPDGTTSFPQVALTDAQPGLGVLLWRKSGNSDLVQPTMIQVEPSADGKTVQTAQASLFDSRATTVFASDVDGDGLADVVTGWNASDGTPTLQLSRNLQQHDAGFAAATAISLPGNYKLGGGATYLGATAVYQGVDFGGDGRSEMVVCYPLTQFTGVVAEDGLHYYDDFQGAMNHPLATCRSKSTYPNESRLFADFNGDGLDDALWMAPYPNNPAATYWELVLNPGPTSLWGGANIPDGITQGLQGDYTSFPPKSNVRIIDYNLDNHPDLLVATPYKSLLVKEYAKNDSLMMQPLTASPLEDDYPTVNGAAILIGGDNSVQVGDVDGDGLSDFVTYESGSFVVYRRNGKRPDMITRIVDGLGAETTFTYQPTSSPAVYTAAATPRSYPLRSVNGGIWVVRQQTHSAGAGRTSTFFHNYTGGVEDMQRGFLGFDSHEVTWYRSDGTVVDEVQQFDNSRQANVDPFVGEPVSVTTLFRDHDGKIVHEVDRVERPLLVYNDDFANYFTYPSKLTVRTKDPDATGALVLTYVGTTSITSVDNAGHVLEANTIEGTTSIQTRTYSATYDASGWGPSWLIDMPTRIVETSASHPPPPLHGVTVTRTTAYQYDAQGGLAWEIVEPGSDASGNIVPLPQPQGDGVQSQFIHYVRDPDGQVGQITEDLGFTATPQQRVTTLYRDGADRVFVTRARNPLGRVFHIASDPGLGVVAATQDENGQYSTWKYDAFGRLMRAAPANAAGESLRYLPYAATGVDPQKPSLELHASSDAGDESVAQHDLLGRVLREKLTARLDGKATLVDYQYDEQGNVVSVTRPRFDGTTASATDTLTYDAADRLTRKALADGRVNQYAYYGAADGLHVDHWDADPSDPTALWSTTIVDGSGRTQSRTQHAAAKDGRPARDLTVSYLYGAFGVLSSATNVGGIHSYFGYDRLGRIISVIDPSHGRRKYGYDAFGDVVTEQLDNELRSSTYDALGRRTTEQTRDGLTKWNWDTSTNGIGLLGSTESPSGVTTTFVYNGQAQLSDVVEKIGDASFDTTTEYDSLGRLSRIRYPSVNGNRFAVRYEYGAHGALQYVKNDASGAPLWTQLETAEDGSATNASGVFPQFVLASGANAVTVRYVESSTRPGLLSQIRSTTAAGSLQSLTYDFDSKGNVSRLDDATNSLQQQFDYDELNRLEHWTVTAKSGQSRVRYDYDDVGNLTGRTMEAGAGTNLLCQYTRERGAGPYAVTAANATLFGYDGEGNETQSGSRTATFSAFGLPLSFPQTGDTFRYDAGGRRAEKVVSTGAAVDDTVIAGGTFRKHSVNGVVDYGYVVPGPTGPMAYLTAGADGVPTATHYILHDYIEDADTIVDGASGRTIETRKFDPFGNRIDPANPTGPAPTARPSPVPFGFAGHEHDWELGLIDMKGRVFDPTIARFLSPDPFTGLLGSPQSLNSYAYAANNPATLNDPTGFYETDPTDPTSWGLPPPSLPYPVGGVPSSGVHYASPARATGGGYHEHYRPTEAKLLRERAVPPAAALPPSAAPPSAAPRKWGLTFDEWDREMNHYGGAFAPLVLLGDVATTLIDFVGRENIEALAAMPVIGLPAKGAVALEGLEELEGLDLFAEEASTFERGLRLLPPAAPANIVANALQPHELVQATRVVALRGGTYVGNLIPNAEGIDGTLESALVSLKTTKTLSPVAVLKHAADAAKSAKDAGYTDVDLYIQALNIPMSKLFGMRGLSAIPNEGTIRAIYVETADGWLVFPGRK